MASEPLEYRDPADRSESLAEDDIMKFVNETMVRSEQAGLSDEINKHYFQFRIDKLPDGN